MTKYNVRPLVAQEIEISTGTIISATWCRYFISITLHQCYIEATWKTRPRTSLFIKIKVVIKTSLEIILYICSEKYFSNNF